MSVPSPQEPSPSHFHPLPPSHALTQLAPRIAPPRAVLEFNLEEPPNIDFPTETQLSETILAEMGKIESRIYPGDVYNVLLGKELVEMTVVDTIETKYTQVVYAKPTATLHDLPHPTRVQQGVISLSAADFRQCATLVKKSFRSFFPVTQERLGVLHPEKTIAIECSALVYSCTRETVVAGIEASDNPEREQSLAQLLARAPKMHEALEIAPEPLKPGFTEAEAREWMEEYCVWCMVREGLCNITPPQLRCTDS